MLAVYLAVDYRRPLQKEMSHLLTTPNQPHPSSLQQVMEKERQQRAILEEEEPLERNKTVEENEMSERGKIVEEEAIERSKTVEEEEAAEQSKTVEVKEAPKSSKCAEKAKSPESSKLAPDQAKKKQPKTKPIGSSTKSKLPRSQSFSHESAERLKQLEKGFVLDGTVVSRLYNDEIGRTQPSLNFGIPQYNAMHDKHCANYFRSRQVPKLNEVTDGGGETSSLSLREHSCTYFDRRARRQ